MFALLFHALPALAGEGLISPPPTPPPPVDLSGVPATADVQPLNPDGEAHPVRARLLVDRTAAQPGGTVRVGLHLAQQPGWHTYWKSPGDIGLPTDIAWQLPDDWGSTPYVYPVPQRFEVEGMVSYGYDDQVLLYTEVTVPADAPLGTQTIGASAEWLVCKTSCIPGSAELTLELPVREGGEATAWAPLFDHYRAQHPVDPASVGLTLERVVDPERVPAFGGFDVALVATGAGRIEPDLERFAFAPITSDGWMLDGLQVGHVGDALVARLKGEALVDEPAAPERVGGLFLLRVDGRPVAVELTETLPWAASGDAQTPTQSAWLHSELTALPAPAWAASTAAAAATPSTPPATSQAVPGGGYGLLANLLFAFFGGLLLNIMPCVLPVLTLKLYSLVEQADIQPAEQRVAGAAYTAGILVSFGALAAAVLVARGAVGANVGWGFQFQYPPYVAALTTIVFAFGLSLFGVFEIPAFGTGTASEAGMKEGPAGYFFTGVFATLLATPCSAPILGTATAFTLAASGPELVAVYLMIGAGLAAPFVLIAFVPAAYRLLPRPGAWMDTFKQLLGFTLVATALWLLGVLGVQIGLDRLLSFLVFLGFVAGGCWVFGHFGGVAATLQRQLGAATVGAVIASVGGYYWVDLAFADEACLPERTASAGELDFSEHIPWQPFSEARVSELAGSTVFIDFTAEWCLTCKVNEKTVLETRTVREAMAAHAVVPLKADWTRKDATISAWLERYGKAGVPFYLVIPPEGQPIPLGEVITPGSVTEALAKAAGT